MSFKYIQLDTGINLNPQDTYPVANLGDLRYNSTTNQLELYNGSVDTILTANDISSLVLNGSTSGSVTLEAPPVVSTYTWTFPDTPGTVGQVLETDGTGILSWVDQSGGGGGVNTALSNLAVTTAANSSIKPGSDLAISLGDASHRYIASYAQSTISSNLTLNGSTSGTLVLTTAPISSVNYQLPGTDGSSGQFLRTNGSGILTWATTTDTGITQLTGDVTAGPGSGSQASTLAKIQGVTVTAPTPTTGDVLSYNGTAWVNTAFSSANTALSNLAGTTAINSDLTFNKSTPTIAAGANTLFFTGNSYIFTGVELTIDNGSSGAALQAVGGSAPGTGGALILGGVTSGTTTIQCPDVGYSGVWTWPSIPGSSGDVMTSNGTGGLSFSPIPVLNFNSNGSSGGASSETLTITGLLATDTILALTQVVAGSNNSAITGYNTLANNALTVTWAADPGTGAIVKVLVKR